MKETTRYRYEKRIEALERENARLRDHRRILRTIYDAIVEMVSEDKKISQGWILRQISELVW